MVGTIDHDAALASKTDLQLNLLSMRMFSNSAPGRYRLKAHGEAAEACSFWEQYWIGVPIGWNRLPVRWPITRLHYQSMPNR
jgi:hypothetical protein